METLVAGSSKAQMKIQQMAFMVVGMMIFFSFIALIYFSISFSNLRGTAQELKEDEAREIVKTISGSSEFAFTSSTDCDSCIDFDKALMLKEMTPDLYDDFWNLDYLMIEKVYPVPQKVECERFNHPDCSQITLINKNPDFGAASSAFVTLVSWDSSSSRYKYELGRIYASGENIK